MSTENDNSLSLLGSRTLIMIPSGLKGVPSSKFDMQEIYRVLDRCKEVATINPTNYGMFVSDLNQVRQQVNRLVGLVDIELREASNGVSLAKSVAFLENVENYLASKKLKSTTDNREAAVLTDPDVQEAIRRKDALTAISEYVKSLREDMDRAYFSAKQIAEMKANDPNQRKLTGG